MKNVIKILSFLMIFTMILGAFSVVVSAQQGEEYKYRDRVFSLYDLGPTEGGTDPFGDYLPGAHERYYYHESYEYRKDASQATPDFVCVTLYNIEWYGDTPVTVVFGDYVIDGSVWYNPTRLGYSVYFPKTDTVCSLEEAYKNNVEGIYSVFTEGKVGNLIGDMDKDRKLTIKDATGIQKCIAELSEWDKYDRLNGEDAPLGYISDFNRDGERNVKDATAIQKCVAGLAY